MPNDTSEFVPENAPDVIFTPEGDNETPPSGVPAAPDVIERPRGNEPHTEQPVRPAQL